MMNKLTRKDVSKAAWTWLFFHQSSHNYERMMGCGFCHSLSKSLKKLYGDDKEGLSEALTRNMTFFNTEPQLGSVIPGITLALEESKAEGGDVDAEMIVNTKSALMGPFAGIGDSILVGTYNPILLSIGIGLAAGGSMVGPLFFLLTWCLTVIPLKYMMFMKGYDLGLDIVKLFMNADVKEKVMTALNIVGLMVIGGVASTTVAAPVKFAFTSGDMTVALQTSILDKIMPGILPMIITVICWYVADKKGWSANKIILLILGIAAVMTILGIM